MCWIHLRHVNLSIVLYVEVLSLFVLLVQLIKYLMTVVLHQVALRITLLIWLVIF